MPASASDSFDLKDWVTYSPTLLPENQDDPSVIAGNYEAWFLELRDHVNQGPFDVSVATQAIDPAVITEISQILHGYVPSVESIPPTLSPHLQAHPCRAITAFQRALIYEAEAPVWGRLLAEMSHLMYQHIKQKPMGTSIPPTAFSGIRDVAMIRLARSSFALEPVTRTQFNGIPEEIQVSWGSTAFCKHVGIHLDEVVRTARENACQRAQYFVCEDSEHLGIIRSDMTDNEKKVLLSQMVFSSDYGCNLLHQFTSDGSLVLFGNRDFACLVKKSLYDIGCPGWCGVLGEMKLPDTEHVTVCQSTDVSTYTVASQIAWLVHVARFYLETQLQLTTTFRPPKRRTVGSSRPTSPWLQWSDSLNHEVNVDAKIIAQFIIGLFVPRGVGHEMVNQFEKIRLYAKFISRPPDIPYLGSLGSFLYADPPPLLIADQGILTTT